MTNRQIVTQLIARGVTIATVESMTGGQVAKTITSVPGASKIFLGALIVYSDDTKRSLLNLKDDQWPKKGAVSKEMAQLMVSQGMAAIDANVIVSVTGNAGPSANDNEPVGKVFIGIGIRNQVVNVRDFNFTGTRKEIREKATTEALRLLQTSILGAK